MATARFVATHAKLLLIGPPGVGKSHVATAIAIGAIRAGRRALVRSTFDLAADFAQADATGARRELVQQLTRVDLLVLEDFGMKKLGGNAAEDLLEVFVRRHETGSTAITTNRPTQDWGVFLGDVPAATAILDRFLAAHDHRPDDGQELPPPAADRSHRRLNAVDGAAAVDAPERAHRGLENADAFSTPPTAIIIIEVTIQNGNRIARLRARRKSDDTEDRLPRGRFSTVPQWPHLNVR